MTISGDKPFKIDVSGAVRAQLRALLVKSREKGIESAMTDAFQRIERRLLNDPSEAGEPLYTLGPPQIAMRVIAVSPLVVEYGVMEEQRVVLVRSFRSLVDLES
jgi:hypothetical protein